MDIIIDKDADWMCIRKRWWHVSMGSGIKKEIKDFRYNDRQLATNEGMVN